MKQSQRTFCRDISVNHRADYWTDHKLLSVKIVLQHKLLVVEEHVRCCFAGYKLRDLSVVVTLRLLGEVVQFGVMI